MKLPWSPLSAAGLGLVLSACGADDPHDSYYGRLVYEVLPDTARGASYDPEGDPDSIYRQFNLSAAFANDQVVEFLDLGPVNPYVPQVYVMVQGGNPVAGQYPIIDTLPDKAEYSSFWQVVEVSVPGTYKANDLKSLSGIKKSGYPQKIRSEALYCPVVNPDAGWVASDGVTYLTDPIYDDPNPDTDCDDALLPPALNVFYGTGEVIPNKDPAFDPEQVGEPGAPAPTLSDADATAGDIRLQPVWHKRLLGFCWPGMTDAARGKRYPLVDTPDGALLDSAAFASRIDLLAVDPDSGEASPTGVLFQTDAGDADYTPALNASDLVIESDTPPTSLVDLDLSTAEPTGLVDNPVVRVVPMAPPASACTDAAK